MLRVSIFFCLFVSSHLSFALSPFEKHFLSVSQSMSAFYMFLLSEEDKSFISAFEQYADQATEDLVNTTNSDEKAFLQRWAALRPILKYEEVKGMGSSIAQKIRFDFRAYLADLYLYYNKQNQNTAQATTAYSRIQLYTALLVARSMDVDSSIYGVNNFTDHDRLVDQVKIANTIDADLQYLQHSKLPKPFLVDIHRIQAKFKFMKPSLVNYSTRSAIFLTYQNALAINEILKAQLMNKAVIATLN